MRRPWGSKAPRPSSISLRESKAGQTLASYLVGGSQSDHQSPSLPHRQHLHTRTSISMPSSSKVETKTSTMWHQGSTSEAPSRRDLLKCHRHLCRVLRKSYWISLRSLVPLLPLPHGLMETRRIKTAASSRETGHGCVWVGARERDTHTERERRMALWVSDDLSL